MEVSGRTKQMQERMQIELAASGYCEIIVLELGHRRGPHLCQDV